MKRLHRYLFKEQKSNYYESLRDFPVWNWWEIHKTNDLTLLAPDGKIDDKAIEVLQAFKDEFVNTFGLGKEYEKIRKREIDIKLLEIQLALNKDRTVLIKIDMLRKEIDSLKASTINDARDPIGKNIRIIEQYRKFELNPKKTSVLTFYGYIEDIKENIEWQSLKK